MKRACLVFVLVLLSSLPAEAQRTSAPGLSFEAVAWAGEGGYGGPVFGDLTPRLVSDSPRHPTGSSLLKRRPSDGHPFRRAAVDVTNTGTQTVKAIRITFVFHDPATGEEVSLLDHSRVGKLRPGQTANMRKAVRRSKRSRRDGAVISVRVREVVYAGGAAWRP